MSDPVGGGAGIGIVGEELAEGDDERAVLLALEAVVPGRRRIRLRRDADAHHAGGAAALAVDHGVDEAALAEGIDGRGEEDAAVRDCRGAALEPADGLELRAEMGFLLRFPSALWLDLLNLGDDPGAPGRQVRMGLRVEL